jgi:L-fuconolactonase
MTITDSQVHIWAAESADQPWQPGGRDFAHGDSYSAEQLIAEMDAAGVDRAVLVPPSFEGDRNDVCLAASSAQPDRFATMGRIALADPQSKDRILDLFQVPGMHGFRLTFLPATSGVWLEDGTADWIWPIAESASIPLMVFAPGQVAQLDTIAARYPSLRLIIDHLGLHTGLRDEQIDPVLRDVMGLAKHENVAVKATCLPGYVTDEYPFPSLTERVRSIVSAFGADRVFWGSDLTRLPCTYGELKTTFTEHLEFLSESELDSIMHRGISTWLDWP